MASQPRSCGNEDCRFSVDGKCVEAYPLDECPHMLRISMEDIQEVETPPNAREAIKVMALSLGEPLNRAQASSLQRRCLSQAISIIGPNNAGKTSLVASIYDLLQEGPIANVGFAGSSTLIGFEKVCHDARAACRRGVPHTERTSAGADVVFFHLDLRHSDGDVVSLFVSDRSGEDYLASADDLTRADEFFELRRADVVTLLVNGEHLTLSEYRHEAKIATPHIVDALVEARALRRGCRVAVVLTKQDSVLASPHADRAQREFDAIVDGIIKVHGQYLGEIDRFVVAASPMDSTNVKRGAGVDRVLLSWLSAAPPPFSISPIASRSTRMIDLLDSGSETAK